MALTRAQQVACVAEALRAIHPFNLDSAPPLSPLEQLRVGQLHLGTTHSRAMLSSCSCYALATIDSTISRHLLAFVPYACVCVLTVCRPHRNSPPRAQTATAFMLSCTQEAPPIRSYTRVRRSGLLQFSSASTCSHWQPLRSARTARGGLCCGLCRVTRTRTGVRQR